MKFAVRLLAFAVLLFSNQAMAELRVDITQGVVEPMPLAVVEFTGDNEQAALIGKQIAQVVTADLERSGLFRPIDPKAFIQKELTMSTVPRFGDWRILNAQALVQGHAVPKGNGELAIQFRLWDVSAETQMVGLAYNTVADNWRRVAHIIADTIYQRITGESGYFDTRVVYVAENGPANNRKKRLAIMDQDGANHRFLTEGDDLVLTPRFSPTLQEITYLSYYNNTPRVYLFNIDSGRQSILGDFPGMTFAPRFSFDGSKVVMSMARDGNSDIYTMDIASRQTRRLTRHSSIDTSPTYSPDGKSIAFNSDRGGSQQLYVMDSNGKNVRRISFGKGRYATPVWSPRGDLIAFTKMTGGKFYIGVMRTDGSGERLLANGYLVESPTWAPNGRVLMFFRETIRGEKKTTKLYSVDLTGYNEREMITPLEASDPAWSPLIP
ncbi:Tol-Pal system beta propeller repeat protein TolB [Terasakiella sp. A23]|nr:Tol-Pal system beta propeller repeat protein TolB [Terasakiella sp. A23]MDV7339114.1 Tol-Pal system beta propeller repeat protein TolB [Terasakiella sp. A23]